MTINTQDEGIRPDPLPDDELIVLIARVGAHYNFDGSEFRSAFHAAARSPEPARTAYRDIARKLFGQSAITKEATP